MKPVAAIVANASAALVIILFSRSAEAADVDVDVGHRELGANPAGCRYEEAWADVDGSVDVSSLVIGAGSRTTSELFEPSAVGPVARHLFFGAHVEAGFVPIGHHATRFLVRAAAAVAGGSRTPRTGLVEFVVRF